MIDIEILRNNPEILRNAVINKGIKDFDFEAFLNIDKKRLKILKNLEDLRSERNKISEEIPKLSNNEKKLKLEEASALKQEIKKLEDEYAIYDSNFKIELLKLPNVPSDKMPVGSGEDENIVVKSWTKKTGHVTPKDLNDTSFIQKENFQYLDHLQLGKNHDMIDTEKSSEVSGSRFSYLKNDAVYTSRRNLPNFKTKT